MHLNLIGGLVHYSRCWVQWGGGGVRLCWGVKKEGVRGPYRTTNMEGGGFLSRQSQDRLYSTTSCYLKGLHKSDYFYVHQRYLPPNVRILSLSTLTEFQPISKFLRPCPELVYYVIWALWSVVVIMEPIMTSQSIRRVLMPWPYSL